MFEEIYQELCVKLWPSDDEATFPINYKAEFLLYFFIEFSGNLSYSRIEKVQSLLKELHERNPENDLVARNYIYTIVAGFYEGIPYIGSLPTFYFLKASETQCNYEFSEKDKNFIGLASIQTL